MGRPAKNLIGQRFGKLIVVERAGSTSDGHAKWKCKCDCGNFTEVSSNSLTKKNNSTKSCGCWKIEKAKEKGNINRIKDISNQRFGKLIALKCVGGTGQSALWKCKCDCGNEIITTSHHLISGNTKSCGCLQSTGEEIISKILSHYNILFEKQKTFKTCIFKNTKGIARFDFFLPQFNRLIEYDGIQHYQTTQGGWNTEETLKYVQQHDQEKNQWAKEHNIPLVRIPYWERDNITLDLILGDKYLVK